MTIQKPTETAVALPSDNALARGIAANPNAPPELLSGIAQGEDDDLRYIVAQNPSTPAEALLGLTRDEGESRGTRDAAAAHPNLSRQDLSSLFEDEVDGVREGMARNPNLPAELVAKLAKGQDRRARHTALRNPALPAELLLAAVAQASDTEAAAQNPALPKEVLLRLGKHESANVRAAAAANPQLPLDVLLRLAEDEEDDVRCAVAANRSSPEKALLELVEDDDEFVRAAAASNPNAPGDALAALLGDDDEDVRRSAARNPNLPTHLLPQLLKSEDEVLREGAAANPAFVDVGRLLSSGQSVKAAATVRTANAGNPERSVYKTENERVLWSQTAHPRRFGSQWVSTTPLPEGDWFRVTPVILEDILPKPRVHQLLIAEWSHAGSLGMGDHIAMSDVFLSAALTIGTPGLEYETLPHFGPIDFPRMWRVTTTKYLGPVVSEVQEEEDDEGELEITPCHPATLDGSNWDGAGFCRSRERFERRWAAFYARRDWLAALAAAADSPIHLHLEPISVVAANGPLVIDTPAPLPAGVKLRVPPLAELVARLRNGAARFAHKLDRQLPAPIATQAAALGLPPPSPELVELLDQVGAAALFSPPDAECFGLEFVRSLPDLKKQRFATPQEFGAFPDDWLPFAFTRDRFLWGIHADGLVRGVGDAAQPYGLPMPFSTWLFLWIEALEAVFDDEDAGEQFFRIDA